jgi:gamma-glutamylcyclotransferase (GGCT)/AIG2-like uncharacterized protein YtfP
VTSPAINEPSFVLFVYGTLLPGEPSHALLDGAHELGPARTPPSYSLIDLGPYPALIAGGSTAVVGALYEMPAAILAPIDVHEEVPTLFKRRRIALADGQEAETYLLDADQVRGRRRIRSGDWRGRFGASVTPGLRDTAFARGLRTRDR